MLEPQCPPTQVVGPQGAKPRYLFLAVPKQAPSTLIWSPDTSYRPGSERESPNFPLPAEVNQLRERCSVRVFHRSLSDSSPETNLL